MGEGQDSHGNVVASKEDKEKRNDGQSDLRRPGLGKCAAEAGDDDETGQEPAGALGGEQEARQGGQLQHDLQQHGDAPAPVRGDVAAGEGDPAAQGAAKVPADHEEGVGDGSAGAGGRPR